MVRHEMTTPHRETEGKVTPAPGPSPTPTSTPTPVTGWEYAYYSYESSHPHAVATIVRDATPEGFTYPAKNMQGGRRCQREHD